MIRLVGHNGDWIAFLIFTPLFLILEETVSKSVYQHRSTEIASKAIYILRVFRYLFFPVVNSTSLLESRLFVVGVSSRMSL